MPRPGELTYYEHIGDRGRDHSVRKPFSDAQCGIYLMRAGALFNLLPPPPARVLDCGCGTGWLAYFLARRGYSVVGTDVSPDAIELARRNPMFEGGEAPEFLVADSEALSFDSVFDAVIFFDSLHHAVDERAALRSAFRALRPGGICVALEPGRGHRRKSREVDSTYDVTDKDMPPSHVFRVGRQIGFESCRAFPAPQHLGKALYPDPLESSVRSRLLSIRPVRDLVVLGILFWQRWYCGISVLRKPS